MDPKGKVALVTGGASGIGLAYTKELLQNGANVAVGDINSQLGEKIIKDIVEQYGKDRAIFIKIDVTNEREFEDAIKQTIEHFKTLDIVINNAGICDDVNWEREVDINLKGVIRGTLLALKYMGKDNGGNGGAVVNTASIRGLQSAAVAPMYVATKHGVVGFSKSLGLPFHFNRTGVSVLTLCPSATLTPLLDLGTTLSMPLDWGDEFEKELAELIIAKPEVVAKSLLHILRVAESGSVWVSEGEETYSVDMPHRKSMKSNK